MFCHSVDFNSRRKEKKECSVFDREYFFGLLCEAVWTDYAFVVVVCLFASMHFNNSKSNG